MTGPSVVRVADPAGLAAAYALRHTVFVEEQQVPVALERDEYDAAAVHVLAHAGGVPVATGRCVVAGDTALLGRIAVLPAWRGTGLGARVVGALEAAAREQGLARAELHAQVAVRGFYERLGWTAVGPEYDEAGIRHVSMTKRL